MKIQNLQQKNGILLIVNQKVIIQNADAEIKFLTRSIESSLCDYSDAYILVTGNIAVTKTIAAGGRNPVRRKQPLTAATQVVFKNCTPFEKCFTETNGTIVDEASFFNITMPMYNLIKYSDNYSGTF